MTLNPFELMKNAKELQSQLGSLQQDMEGLRVEGASGGGLVRVTLSGRLEMIKLELDPIVVDNRDISMLQDLIRSAYNDAVEKVKEALKDKIGPLASLTGGIPF